MWSIIFCLPCFLKSTRCKYLAHLNHSAAIRRFLAGETDYTAPETARVERICACPRHRHGRRIQTGRKHGHNAVVIHEPCSNKLKCTAEVRKKRGKNSTTALIASLASS